MYIMLTKQLVAAFFDYYVSDGNMRAGNISSVWDEINVIYNETGTGDLNGSTSGVTFSVDISGPNVRVLATITSGTWNIKIGSRII